MTREQLVAGAFADIQKGSKSFRAASRLFHPLTRERVWLLYCWCRHCDDVCDGQTLGFGAGPAGSVSELRAKTARAVSGETVGELPFDALRQLLSECEIPTRFLTNHLDGFALDADGWRPQTEQDLERYCYHVAGTVGGMMAIVMGVPPAEDETLERAAELGIAFQLSNIARDLRDDWASGRCYVPAEWLAELNTDPQRMFEPQNEAALLTIARRLVARMEYHEAAARIGVARLPFRSRLAVLAALRIYGAIGRRVGELGASAWDQRVSIGKARKLGFLVPTFTEAVASRRRI